ncbi:uncharacterized protein BKA78DRAFT_352503 [Phyllosticta capitalensis]|uniref:uncharacterized protein n=1 Tax=Phyllosticta capitalensis TaxID=121624 RepID=UPI00312E6E5D
MPGIVNPVETCLINVQFLMDEPELRAVFWAMHEGLTLTIQSAARQYNCTYPQDMWLVSSHITCPTCVIALGLSRENGFAIERIYRVEREGMLRKLKRWKAKARGKLMMKFYEMRYGPDWRVFVYR